MKIRCRYSPLQYGRTPKALANSSPGFERSREPWDKSKKRDQTLKGWPVGEPFQG
jgi:hypothetical protein